MRLDSLLLTLLCAECWKQYKKKYRMLWRLSQSLNNCVLFGFDYYFYFFMVVLQREYGNWWCKFGRVHSVNSVMMMRYGKWRNKIYSYSLIIHNIFFHFQNRKTHAISYFIENFPIMQQKHVKHKIFDDHWFKFIIYSNCATIS